jgi:tetratricopeptide (TPR) repeat protein
MQQMDTDNPEFQNALKLIQYTRQSVFLTGRAGTGKSTFLRYICSITNKRYVVLAPTGVAAINAGGVTIHSFFKMPFRPLLPDDPDLSLQENRIFNFLKYRKEHRKLIEAAELIIIDEISMVRADVIDFIDRVLRVYSGNMREPFGGKQLLLVGDVYQLEPVVKADEKEILRRFYASPFFFSARVFKEMNLVSIELQKVYRQTDEAFVRVLDNIRINSLKRNDLDLLNTRCNPTFKPSDDDFYVTLATKRDVVDYINDEKLRKLDGKAIIFKGEITGEFNESSLPTLKELELKENAQIIFIKNDPDRRWFNGTIGRISCLSEEGEIIVQLENGEEYELNRDIWRNIRYRYDEKENKITEEELGSFVQYPIRLAWAITVHKSQGLTFDKVIVDFSGGVFAGGQAYVALSRCTSLQGMVLKKPLVTSDIFIRDEIVHFARSFNNQQIIDKSLKQAQADVFYTEAVQHFDKGQFELFFDNFFKAIHARYDIEKPLIKRFMQRKLQIINKLKDKNKQLERQLLEQREKMKTYADEYYAMGKICIESGDAKAALGNFDKAVSLYPLHVDAWIIKGVTLHDTGDFYQAEKCLNEAVRLSPLLFKAVFHRGENRIALENYEGAISDLTKAIVLKKKHPKAHELLGNAYSKIGDVVFAMRYWEKAQELEKRKR